jgi:predicted CXXCH cytochrome family protein
MDKMKKILKLLSITIPCVLAIVMSLAPADEVGTSVTKTKHNLSSKGPGTVKVAGTREVCKFCHTPHSSNPIAPLWNRHNPGTYYQTYKSSTLVARVGQPSGSSRLCLSCHDGTIALAQTFNSRNAPSGSIFISSKDKGYLGTDLSDDHPISFVYSSAVATAKGQLLQPSALPKQLALDENKQLQCTTCHNAHDDRFGKFLTMNNSESAMCRTCHLYKDWNTSSHAVSSASLGGLQKQWGVKASTVREAACGACHKPHTAGGRQRLLRYEAEEDNCLSCHNGSVAKTNIAAEIDKISSHPVRKTTGVHDPVEDYQTMRKHVECADCHNPHRIRKNSNKTQAPFIKNAMVGATGIATSGNTATEATYEYEVCYKCHGGRGTVRTPLVDRVIVNTNVADEFARSNPSFHPVEARGRNTNVPSLTQKYKFTSYIYCTDCHGSESKKKGVRGPHGSRYSPMLVRQYTTADMTTESPTAYALCYGCHTRTSILGNRSFGEHNSHITTRKAPCSACHDPHGVSSTQVAGASGTHLINFDRDIVKASTTTQRGPTFTDTGTFRGTCTLNCHGEEHVNRTYPK